MFCITTITTTVAATLMKATDVSLLTRLRAEAFLARHAPETPRRRHRATAVHPQQQRTAEPHAARFTVALTSDAMSEPEVFAQFEVRIELLVTSMTSQHCLCTLMLMNFQIAFR